MEMDEDEVEVNLEENSDLVVELTKNEVAEAPSDTGDPPAIVEVKIPHDIRDRYEIYSYRNAAAILSETRKSEFEELLKALRAFNITKAMIRSAGGNESQIPKLLSNTLLPLKWYETVVQGDLVVKKTWREQAGVADKGKNKGKPLFRMQSQTVTREKYLDGHKIDYVKGRVAFDMEWNSKDQTFDRDLYAFSAFFQCGVIRRGSPSYSERIVKSRLSALGDALKRDGVTIDLAKSGKPKQTYQKFGASTTWMGKLLYRLNAGRNGGCPVLVVGITPKCIEDWTPGDEVAAKTLPPEMDS